MIVCVALSRDGTVDPRWGRAAQVALVTVEDGAIADWREVAVSWDVAHDTGSERAHHARVARFLRDNAVEVVVAEHMGAGMSRMLHTMGIGVRLGASGDARRAVLAVPSR